MKLVYGCSDDALQTGVLACCIEELLKLFGPLKSGRIKPQPNLLVLLSRQDIKGTLAKDIRHE